MSCDMCRKYSVTKMLRRAGDQRFCTKTVGITNNAQEIWVGPRFCTVAKPKIPTTPVRVYVAAL